MLPSTEERGEAMLAAAERPVTSANSSRNNEPIIRLLLARGAPVRPETLVRRFTPPAAPGGLTC